MSDSVLARELEVQASHLLELAKRIRQEAAAKPDDETQRSRPSRLLRAREAAELLGVSQKRLYDLTTQPNGPPHVRLGERTMRWPLRDLEGWIRERATGDCK